jgi:hypothetical protein
LLKYEIGPEPKVGLPRTMHSFAWARTIFDHVFSK